MEYVTQQSRLGDAYIWAKLGNQRKARQYSVRPTNDDRIVIQEGYGGKGSIGIFDFEGRGVFATSGAHFPFLAGAKPYQFPLDFVRAAMGACPALDAETEYNGVTFRSTIRMVS